MSTCFFLGLSKTDSETAAEYKKTLKRATQTSVALSFLTFLLKSVVLQHNERIYFKHLFEEFPAKTKMRIKIKHSFHTLNNPVQSVQLFSHFYDIYIFQVGNKKDLSSWTLEEKEWCLQLVIHSRSLPKA